MLHIYTNLPLLLSFPVWLPCVFIISPMCLCLGLPLERLLWFWFWLLSRWQRLLLLSLLMMLLCMLLITGLLLLLLLWRVLITGLWLLSLLLLCRLRITGLLLRSGLWRSLSWCTIIIWPPFIYSLLDPQLDVFSCSIIWWCTTLFIQ